MAFTLKKTNTVTRAVPLVQFDEQGREISARLNVRFKMMQRAEWDALGNAPEVDELDRRGVRIRFIGERSRFASGIVARMAAAEAQTAGNTRLQLAIAASYGGRQDIACAARELAAEVAAGRLRPEDIDEATLDARMALADLPPPDLFIRTGGDHRISNFLLWQLAYTELWFTETLWPDVDAGVLAQALDDYAGRERRFGLTSAQVGAETPA